MNEDNRIKMIRRKQMDFLKALKMHDLAAEAKLFDILSAREPMPVNFGMTGGKITFPDDPYCPRCGEYLGGFIDDCRHCPECGQALSWESDDDEDV